MIYSSPFILAGIMVEVYSRGMIRLNVARLLVVVSYLVLFLLYLPVNLQVAFYYYPLPFTTLIQLLILQRFRDHLKKRPKTKIDEVPIEAKLAGAGLMWPRVFLWLATMTIPHVVYLVASPDLTYQGYTVFGAVWAYTWANSIVRFDTILPTSVYAGVALGGLALAAPLIVSAFFVHRYSHGEARRETARRAVLFSIAYNVLVGVILTLLWTNVAFIPIPLMPIVQYVMMVPYKGIYERYERPPELARQVISPAAEVMASDERVTALRGCAVVGGSFEYKAKIQNDSRFVITNVTVTIVAYPEECLEIVGPTLKKLPRIEPGGFRSPQFVFQPTKDCVEGQIIASVSYMDQENRLQMVEVEPYVIRSVCDLLEPLEASVQELELMLGDMAATREEHTVETGAKKLFSKTKDSLPDRNYFIIEATEETAEGSFRGIVRALAEGKYTKKKVAVRVVIMGFLNRDKSELAVECLAQDPAMLPIAIEEIVKIILS
jgi:hypothetical protein